VTVGFPIGFSGRRRESQTTSRNWNEYAFVRSQGHLDFVSVQQYENPLQG